MEEQTYVLRKTNQSTWIWYLVLTVLTTIILVASICTDQINDVIVAVPILVLLILLLFFDKNFVHIPPKLIFFVVIVMFVSLISGVLRNGDISVLAGVKYVLVGVILGVLGLIVTYASLGRRPGLAREKPVLVALQALTFGLAIYFIWLLISYYILGDYKIGAGTAEVAMFRGGWILVGCTVTSIAFFVDRFGLMGDVVLGFLNENELIDKGIDDNEAALELIETGETNNVEFKSTIRTNLATGEKDKRMEKAVLKTLVAFLNTDGGTLFVGVQDDGNIMGLDIESFDNRDKMNLHVTHLISSQIGDEFLPFIKFKVLEFGKREDGNDKLVMRFDCKPTLSPVFYKDSKDKSEIYFIRSGPSTIELTGVDLLKYVANRNKVGIKKNYLMAMKD